VICHDVQQCGVDGITHDATWIYEDGHTEHHDICIEDGEPEVTLEMVRKAFRKVPLPTPELGMNPVNAVTFVNLPTIFHTEAEPFPVDLRILSQDVHLEIAPVRYDWNFGACGGKPTDWPGQPFQSGVLPEDNPDSYVSCTYQATGTSDANVTVVWGATYTVNGGTEHDVDDEVPTPSSFVTVTAKEGRPVLY